MGRGEMDEIPMGALTFPVVGPTQLESRLVESVNFRSGKQKYYLLAKVR